ncbi:MAG: transcriptional regulator [Phycisphaerales bacterium]|nr:transcriptional regulator [Phycisphaerales bacterium]
MPLAVTPELPALRTDEPLLWLVGCGHEVRRGPAYYYDASQRDEPPHVVLQLTLDGAAFVRPTGQAKMLLPTGHAFFHLIPGPFEYGWASGVYEQVFISLAGAAANEWMRHVHRLHGAVLDFGADPSVAQTMLSIVEAHASGRLIDRYFISGQLYGLLMQVLSVLARRRIAATRLVTACLEIIEAEGDRPKLNVNALASRLNRSREHLTREFHDATGVSPSTYLTQTRVRLAAAELRAGEAKLETVARRSGFSSAAYLCRVFQKTVGVTPVQFRERPWLVAP